MKTNVYIVRHAETIGNIENRLTGKSDFEISIKGKRSIEALTYRLSNIKFDNLYSSQSNRTKETIEALAKLNNKKIIQIEELGEINFGEYDGMKWEEVNIINPNIKKRQLEINEISGIPGQESMKELENRISNCIESIIEDNKGKTILICSHGVAIEAFLRKIRKVPFSMQRQEFCQHNTAINQIEIDDEGNYNIVKMSDITHITTKNIVDNKILKKAIE